MSEDYFSIQALHSTGLTTFMESPDHCLLPQKERGYFELGHQFETLVFDRTKNQNSFFDAYGIIESEKQIPDEILEIIKSNTQVDQLYVYNKDGKTLNGTKKTYHAHLDRIKANPGKIPMSSQDYESCQKMIDNFAKITIEGLPIFELLSQAWFQQPCFWKVDDIKKKALFDAVCVNDGEILIFDFKTAQNQRSFRQMLGKYVVQAIHYTEAAANRFDTFDIKFIFLVVTKEEPFVSFPAVIEIDEDSKSAYQRLCSDMWRWIEDGKQAMGALPMKNFRTKLFMENKYV